jgi:putative flippase GtrA
LPTASLKSLLLYCVRFGISGGLATAAHWGVMAILVTAGLPPLAATCLAINDLLQFHFTFRRQACHRTALPAYLVTVALGWSANLLLFALLFDGVGWSASLAQLTTTAGVTFLNLFWYKRFVFHERVTPPVAS